MIELLKPIRIRRLSPWKILIKNIITTLLADDDSALKELFRAQVEDAEPALDLPDVRIRLTQCFKNQASSYAEKDPFLHKIIDTP